MPKSDVIEPNEDLTVSDPSAHQLPNLAHKPICIIDDDEAVTHSLRLLLESSGFEVQSYSSGAEFLADDRRRTVGCLVIDLHMPGLDGLEVVGRLRQEGVWLPTILVSGRLDARATERAASLGVTDIVEKPFAAKRMVDLIRANLATG